MNIVTKIMKSNMYRYFDKNKLALGGSIILALLCFGVFLFPHYASDTYKIILSPKMTMADTWNNYTKMYIECGRYTLGILMLLVSMLNINPLLNGFFSNLVSILFFAGAVFISYKLLSNKIEGKKSLNFLCFICCSVIFLNPMFADWFQFSECVPYYSFGLLVVLYSVKICFKSENINIWNLSKSLALLVLGVGIYQPLITYFVFCSLLVIFNRYITKLPDKHAVKQLLKETVYALGIYLVAALMQIIVVKISGYSGRNNTAILDNLQVVFEAQKGLWLMQHTGEKSFLYLIITIVNLIFMIFLGVLSIKKLQGRAFTLFISIAFFVMAYISIFSTHIVSEPWLSLRTTVVFNGLCSFVVLISLSLLSRLGITTQRVFYTVSTGLMCILLVVFSYDTGYLGIGLLKTNALDAQIVRNINELIKKNEQKTGVIVTKLSFKRDTSVTWCYPDTICRYDYNIRSWAPEWSVVNMFNTYSKRNLEQVEMPEFIYNKFFKDKNWDSYSEESVYIDNDTVYIAIY